MNKIATVYKIEGGNLAKEEHGDSWQGVLAEQYFGLAASRVDTVVNGGVLTEQQQPNKLDVHKYIEPIIERDTIKSALPRLSPKGERELGLKVKAGTSIDEQGNRKLNESAEQAQRKLFLSNFGLALEAPSRFRSSLSNTYISILDLKQAALRTLFEVCGRYDGRGKFSSYAYRSIDGQLRNEIKDTRLGFSVQRWLLHLDRQVRSVKSKAELSGKLLSYPHIKRHLVRARCKRYEIQHGHKPDKIEQEKIERAYGLVDIRWVVTHKPYNRPYPQVLDEPNLETLKVADGEYSNNQNLFNRDRAIINLAVSNLPPRERFIIEMRFGIGGNSDDRTPTLAELGDMWGITREAIRRIEEKALKRLSKRLREFAPESQSE